MSTLSDYEQNKMIWVQCYCWFYPMLSGKKQQEFIELLDQFVHDTKIVGIGLDITDEMKIAVGGWAVLLILHRPLGLYWYRHIERVSIYPGDTLKTGDMLGMLADGVFYCQVHLAWDDVRDSATRASDNRNTILHEFAHALDLINRNVDANLSGLLNKEEAEHWRHVFRQDYFHSKPEKLRNTLWAFFGLDAWHAFDPKDTSCLNLAELFAVATEKYFEEPLKLKQLAPDIYDCLLTLYRFDTLKEIPK